jgi:pimeloyl-ACP methyl ester carboxylesterase
MNTCIFFPGWGSSHYSKYLYIHFLKKIKGFDQIYTLFKPHLGMANSIPELSDLAASYIKNNINEDEITFIGYSMGGLIALDLISYHNDIKEKTKAAITISTPVYGADKHTKLHTFSTIFSRSSLDMCVKGPYLSELRRNIPNDVNIFSIAGQKDELISQKSALYKNAKEKIVINKAHHLDILYKYQTIQEINSLTQEDERKLPPLIRFIDLS